MSTPAELPTPQDFFTVAAAVADELGDGWSSRRDLDSSGWGFSEHAQVLTEHGTGLRLRLDIEPHRSEPRITAHGLQPDRPADLGPDDLYSADISYGDTSMQLAKLRAPARIASQIRTRVLPVLASGHEAYRVAVAEARTARDRRRAAAELIAAAHPAVSDPRLVRDIGGRRPTLHLSWAGEPHGSPSGRSELHPAIHVQAGSLGTAPHVTAEFRNLPPEAVAAAVTAAIATWERLTHPEPRPRADPASASTSER